MSCEHLICAHCAAPVVEGRCPACRAAREKIHGPSWSSVFPALIVLAGLLLLLSTLALRHLAV